MREVRIDSQRFADPELLHDDETQTVDQAVRLIAVVLEVGECGALFVRRRQWIIASFSPYNWSPSNEAFSWPILRVSVIVSATT
jgi:hypothetical protein